MSEIRVAVDATDLAALGKLIRAEKDGKILRAELVAGLKAATAPGVSAVREKLRAIPHTTAVYQSPPLGSYLASRTRTQVRLSGRRVGVYIRIPKTPKLRGFAMAARRLDRDAWRHPVFGRDIWVDQESPIPGFFTDTLAEEKPRYREAVLAAMNSMARRLRARAFLAGR